MDLSQAIQNRQIITFTYDGLPRVVQPATYGRTRPGNLTLRGCQIDGQSKRNSIPCWELYTEAKIMDLQSTGAVFTSFELAGYTTGDSAFAEILAEF